MEAVIMMPGEGERVEVGGSVASLKAVSETAAGAFSLSEVTIEPGFPGPPPHAHRESCDTFYVLEGELHLMVGDRRFAAPPGAFVAVPPGVVHTFSNPGARPVRFLNINSPAGWEDYLRDLLPPCRPGPPRIRPRSAGSRRGTTSCSPRPGTDLIHLRRPPRVSPPIEERPALRRGWPRFMGTCPP